MKVAELRRILEDLPEDMPVMTPGPSGDGFFQPVTADWFWRMKMHASGRGYQGTEDPEAPLCLVIWRK
jgi:hypothetical protein